VGARFLVSLLGAMLATVAVLVGAGFLVLGAGHFLAQVHPLGVRGDPFRTGAFEFDLAPGWQCERDGGEYVCNPPGPPPHSAIAIIAMKERGDQDSLDKYEEHLEQAHPPTAAEKPGRKPSQVRFVKRVRLGQSEWVESLQAGSEIPNYDTYYLATVTSLLGILVTLSVERAAEATYIKQLNEMMSTLNVYQR
jgi:hypothetical protein